MPGANPGYYQVPIPYEEVLWYPANGGTVIWGPADDQETLQQMRVFYRSLHRNDMIVTAEPAVKSGVVFTAWGVLVRCKHFSGQAALDFIATFGDGKALKKVEPTASPVGI